MKKTAPNILFIMADDHAAKAISAYGHGINQTPHIDRLAREGMRMNHCYVSNSICTPSRAAILTGTYNHVNCVMTLADAINNRLPNVAKHLQTGGYQTAIIGKWHLGEGPMHEPTGFDYWSVLPGQGDYFAPIFHEPQGEVKYSGYVSDIITRHSLDWLKQRDASKPFFLMCHHKAPHRSWEYHPKFQNTYSEPIKLPDTFTDDYKNRAKAASVAKMRIADDMTYLDLGLVQSPWETELDAHTGAPVEEGTENRKLPNPQDISSLRLTCKYTGEVFSFTTQAQYDNFKFQRYMQRYLRTIASIDESVGDLLGYLDAQGLTNNTLVIYTSDQGFFLGEHGWYDKRFMYEESFQMPFLVRYPPEIKAGTVCNDILSNVDFAPTFLDMAGLLVPSYMQGRSFRFVLQSQTPADWPTLAYHRYWMHRDEHHNAYAHYGIRNQRYKLIYWYNQGMGLLGTQVGGEPPEWELFDCAEDPMELFNCYAEPSYAGIVKFMTAQLEAKMQEIGDEPAHPR
jgi:arylsulfatase A-like enzyme